MTARWPLCVSLPRRGAFPSASRGVEDGRRSRVCYMLCHSPANFPFKNIISISCSAEKESRRSLLPLNFFLISKLFQRENRHLALKRRDCIGHHRPFKPYLLPPSFPAKSSLMHRLDVKVREKRDNGFGKKTHGIWKVLFFPQLFWAIAWYKQYH